MARFLAALAACAVWGAADAQAAEKAAPLPDGKPPPGTASSQVASAPDGEREARSRFENGLRFYEEGHYQAALAEFQASLDGLPTRAAMINAVVCLRSLGRYDEALELFERLPTRFELSEEEQRDWQAELAELSRHVGWVEFVGLPANARIWIDGRERPPSAGKVRLSAGTRALRIEAAGHPLVATHLELAAGQHFVLQLAAVLDASKVDGSQAKGASSSEVGGDGRDSVRPATAPPPQVGSGWFVALSAGPLYAPELGGDVAGCAPLGCSSGEAWGTRVTATLGRQIASRWTLSGDAGFVGLDQTVRSRQASVLKGDAAPDRGLASDALHLRAATLGASIGHRRTLPLEWGLRLGLGALVGKLVDDRSGTFVRLSPSGAASVLSGSPAEGAQNAIAYDVAESSSSWATYAYLSLSAEVGLRPLAFLYLGVAAETTLALALYPPRWRRPVPDFLVRQEGSWFPAERLLGGAFLLVSPLLVVRYER